MELQNELCFSRCQELEAEVQKLRTELEALRARASTEGAASMTSSVAKVVQPTATVSSVPVCGPSKKQCSYPLVLH